MDLHVGDRAPAFDLPATTGGNISLESLRGKKVVLYFYPKDQTPGCTREACDFRDRHAALEGSGAVVLGVSKDSLKSHDNFREKQALPFPLLTDADNAVAKAYGAFGEKTMYGKPVTGTIRSTFLIDEAGRIGKIWSPVRVDGHADDVLAAVRGETGPDAAEIPPANLATGVLIAAKSAKPMGRAAARPKAAPAAKGKGKAKTAVKAVANAMTAAKAKVTAKAKPNAKPKPAGKPKPAAKPKARAKR